MDASEVWLLKTSSVKALFPYQEVRNLITWFVCFFLRQRGALEVFKQRREVSG